MLQDRYSKQEQIGEPPGSPICFSKPLRTATDVPCGYCAGDGGASCCDDDDDENERSSFVKDFAARLWIEESLRPPSCQKTARKSGLVRKPTQQLQEISS
jgi:hypothetical protein